MAKTYADLQKQIQELSAEAAAIKAEEKAGVVGRIKEAIAVYGITAQELGLRAGTGRTSRGSGRGSSSSYEAKYSDGNGQVWGGRGPRPAWLREAMAGGRALEDFAVSHTGEGNSAEAVPAEADVATTRSRSSSKRAVSSVKAASSKSGKGAAKKGQAAARRTKRDAVSDTESSTTDVDDDNSPSAVDQDAQS